MAQLMEYVDYLSKEIGPRPAGTEEEHQAALYITERFQKDAGFSAQIEEFTCKSNIIGFSAIPGLIVVVVAVLAMIFPILSIPAFIIAALAAAIYTAEALGHPFITKSLGRGASQNVVAKYQPDHEAQKSGRGRSRKIVLVAHYDSGKVTPGPVRKIESMGLPVTIDKICIGGIIAAAFFLLLHIIVNEGVGAIVVNALTVLALIVCLYPAVRAILFRSAPYNEGANNNATGAAALLEVARRIARGSVSEADLADGASAAGVRIHGESAARESGLVPEGAQIVYEAEQLQPPAELGEYSEEERLLAAKAAIAALTGQPVERRVYGSAASKLVNSRVSDDIDRGGEPAGRMEQPAFPEAGEPAAPFVSAESVAEPGAAGLAAARPAAQAEMPRAQVQAVSEPASDRVATPVSTPEPIAEVAEPAQASGYENAPSWFVAAQRNAKKPEAESAPPQRSRYAEAIEAAEREMAEREHERQAVERARREAELKAREEAARAAIAMSGVIPMAEANAEAKVEGEVAPAAEAAIEPGMPEGIVSTGAASAEALDGAETLVAADGGEAAEPAQTAPAPLFTPFAEAHPEDMPMVGARPADDEFAASLGSTTAFTPLALNRDEGENADENADEGTGESGIDQAEQADQTEQSDQAGQAEGPTTDQVESPASLLASLPSVVAVPAAPVTEAPENTSPSRSGLFRKLRADVPSMSGVIRMQAAGEDVSQPPVTPPAPASVPDQGASERQALSANVPVPEVKVDDANAPQAPEASRASEAPEVPEAVDYDMELSQDDRRDFRDDFDEYQDEYYDEYDYEDDDAIEMPKSRAGGFFSRFRRKNKREELEETPQEWLDVDEDFDARTVGRERGGWESFRDDASEDGGRYKEDDRYEDERRRGRRWEGGSYSRVQLGHVDTRSGEVVEAEVESDFPEYDEDRQIADEIEQIYHFRNPLYNTEIWFVALGSEVGLHDGVNAFMAEHSDDLRGAVVVEVESLGAGELCLASDEGRINKVTTSSRMKRFLRGATEATGIAPGSVSLVGFESAACVMQRAGHQAMHLLGVEDGAPALKGSADDVLENVDDLLFDDNVNFLMELLKK